MKKIYILACALWLVSPVQAEQNITSANTPPPATTRICQQATTHYVFDQATNTTCESYIDVPVTQHDHHDDRKPERPRYVYIGPEEYFNPQTNQWQNTPPVVTPPPKVKSCFELRQTARALNASNPTALAEIKRKPCRQLYAEAELQAQQAARENTK